MKILPPIPALPKAPITRRHQPRISRGASGFLAYRPCLRWEFGFSCAFCGIHEADFTSAGASEWGVFQIEHFVPEAQYQTLRIDYTNLFYACRFCNQARGATPRISTKGYRLLNPCEVTWADHFQLEQDNIVPIAGDLDASYTVETYDLNDPRKVRLRRLRRETLTARLDFIAHATQLEDELLDRAPKEEDSLKYLDLAKQLHSHKRQAYEDLLRFAAIPQDADSQCLCDTTEHHTLPVWFSSRSLTGFESPASA